MGSAADKISVLLLSKRDAETVHCLELFRDYIRVVRSVQAMVATRNKVLATYHTALTTLEGLQTDVIKLQANPAKKQQLADKEKQVVAAQHAVDAEASELKTVTASCLAEAQRFRIEKLRDLKHVITDFVKTQIEHAKKVRFVCLCAAPFLSRFAECCVCLVVCRCKLRGKQRSPISRRFRRRLC